jgi:hypothetical protein
MRSFWELRKKESGKLPKTPERMRQKVKDPARLHNLPVLQFHNRSDQARTEYGLKAES